MKNLQLDLYWSAGRSSRHQEPQTVTISQGTGVRRHAVFVTGHVHIGNMRVRSWMSKWRSMTLIKKEVNQKSVEQKETASIDTDNMEAVLLMPKTMLKEKIVVGGRVPSLIKIVHDLLNQITGA